MKQINIMPSRFRLSTAGVTAVSGGIVSIAMAYWGGSMARFLPAGEALYPAAVLGAGLAGLACADGFGRPGARGWAIAALASIVATIAGAVLGSGLLGVVMAGNLGGAGLGLIAIMDAATSLPAVGIWTLSMVALHMTARHMRQGLSP